MILHFVLCNAFCQLHFNNINCPFGSKVTQENSEITVKLKLKNTQERKNPSNL